MITPKETIHNYSRERHFFDSRIDKMRLEFNEYVPHIDDTIFKLIMKDITAETLSMYPELKNTYAALSTHIRQPIEKILLTAGADQAIFQVLNAFCAFGDRIGIIEPNFSMYNHYAKIIGCEIVQCFYDAEWTIQMDKLSKLIQANCKLIIITSPNSYTGMTIQENILDSIIKECWQKEILVLLDEVYLDFSNEDCASFIDSYDNVLSIRSFSKSVGLAGLRAGYILSNPVLIDYIYRASFGVEINSVAAKVIELLCNKPELYNSLIKNILESKVYFTEALIQLGLNPIETQTNFVPIKLQNKEQLIAYLKKQNVKARKYPPIPFFEEFISFTVGTKETMEKLISILGNFIKEN